MGHPVSWSKTLCAGECNFNSAVAFLNNALTFTERIGCFALVVLVVSQDLWTANTLPVRTSLWITNHCTAKNRLTVSNPVTSFSTSKTNKVPLSIMNSQGKWLRNLLQINSIIFSEIGSRMAEKFLLQLVYLSKPQAYVHPSICMKNLRKKYYTW